MFLLFVLTSKIQAFSNPNALLLTCQSTLDDTVYYTENITICRASLPYFYSNNLYTSEGTYKIYLKTNEGKDSVVTLNLTVLDIPQRPETIKGDTLINEIGSYIYKIDTVKYATEYSWYISNMNWSTNKSKADTTKLFIPTGGMGVLSVTAKNICGISASNQVTIQSSLQIKDNVDNTSFSIYPNPSYDKVYVSFPSSEKREISIYDISGRKIQNITSTNATTELNLSELTSGIYFLQIFNYKDQTILTSKLSKK